MPSVLKVNEVQSDTDLPLVFNVGNAERGRIDTSGNMGLGTTSPIAKLHVVSGASTGVFANSNAGQAHFYGTDGTAAIGLYANNSTGNQIYWGGSDILRFVNVSTERARFNSTGAFVFNGGTTTADGIGITFPATQSASSNANTLDDYEEGTWTPTDASGAGLTFTDVTATYTKIGRMVFAQFALRYPSTANGSNSLIGGMPFAPASGNSARQGFVSYTDETTLALILPEGGGATTAAPRTNAGAQITNAIMSLNYIWGEFVYFV